MRYLFILLVMGLLSSSASSQTAITRIVQNGQKIELTITSGKKFYVGGNIHILHIGKKEFSLSKQSSKEGKGIITFYIPVEDFEALTAGDDAWMTYGNKFRKGTEGKDPSVFCKKNPKVSWYLGKFSKQLTGN